MRVYQFCAINEWLVQNVFKRQIYLNTPDNFNDPTENNFSIGSYRPNKSKRKEYKQDLLKSLMSQEVLKNKLEEGVDFFSLSQYRESLKSVDPSVVEDIRDSTLKQFAYSLVRRAQKEYRISCFTTELFNPLMWGHYAGGMRGACLEYDIDEEHLHKVSYGKTYSISIQNILSGKAEDEVKNTFLRKSKYWRYENEYRMILKDGSFFKLRKPQLKNVYFGYKSDIERVEFAKELVEHSYGRSVGFYVARNSIYNHDINLEDVRKGVGIREIMELERSKVDKYETLESDQAMAELIGFFNDELEG